MFESFLGGYKYYLQLLNTWPPYNCSMSTELARQYAQLLRGNNPLALSRRFIAVSEVCENLDITGLFSFINVCDTTILLISQSEN